MVSEEDRETILDVARRHTKQFAGRDVITTNGHSIGSVWMDMPIAIGGFVCICPCSTVPLVVRGIGVDESFVVVAFPGEEEEYFVPSGLSDDTIEVSPLGIVIAKIKESKRGRTP